MESGKLMGLILELPGFYTYPWQNRLAEAQALVAYAGYRIASEIAVGDNDLELQIELPPGVDELKARMKLLEVLNQSSCTLFLRSKVGGVILPPAPPEKPWYETAAVGTRLKVVRAEGLEVFTDSGLSAVWNRGRLPIGNTSMTVAALYDAGRDRIPPIGVLCVLKSAPPSFPNGLWVIAIGNDGQANVEIVT